MEGVDPGVLSAVIAGSGMYVALMPPLADVRRASIDSATARDVRTGIAMSSAALIGSGLVIAVLEHDPKPLAMTVALAVLMGCVYEITLRQQPEPGEHPAGDPPDTVGRWQRD